MSRCRRQRGRGNIEVVAHTGRPTAAGHMGSVQVAIASETTHDRTTTATASATSSTAGGTARGGAHSGGHPGSTSATCTAHSADAHARRGRAAANARGTGDGVALILEGATRR